MGKGLSLECGGGGDFRANHEADPAISIRLNPSQLAECFSTELHQSQLDTIYKRLDI
jgi:adenylosuccinate lyase